MRAIDRVRQSQDSTQKQTSWLPIALILTFAVVLYCFKLGQYGLSTDELYSVYDARNLDVFQARPLYYVLLRGWMAVSTSEGWLRSLGLLWGLVSVFLTYRLGDRLINRSAGLIAALLLTLSPLMIDQAQNVRMYTLGNALNLAGTLALAHALVNYSGKTLGIWAIARWMCILATPLNFTILSADALLIVLRFRKHPLLLKSAIVWFSVIFLLWVPFALQLFGFKQDYRETWGTEVNPPSIMEAVRQLKFQTFWPFRVPDNALLAHFHRLATAMIGGVLAFALLRKRQDSHLVWLAAWLFIPLLGLMLISSVSTNAMISRYLLFLSPYLLLLLAAGLQRIGSIHRGAAFALALVYAIAVGSGIWEYYRSPGEADWRGTGEMLSQQVLAGDVIAVSIPHGRICPFLTHYYQGNVPIYSLLAARSQVQPQEMTQSLAALPPHPRIWLLYRKASGRGDEMFQAAMNQKFTVQSTQRFRGGIRVYLLQPKADAALLATARPQLC